MQSKRVHNRSQQALPTLWAAFACADVMTEATRRQLGAGAEAPLAQSSGQVFVFLGRALSSQLRQLLTADERYQALQDRQRQYQARRDDIASRLQHEFVEARRFLKGLFGYAGACQFLGFAGPSPREPKEVLYQVREAVWWAKNQAEVPESLFVGAEKRARQCVDQLDGLCRELDQAMDDVGLGRCEVVSAMLAQQQAMRDFDRVFKESARTMEAQLILVGLPTLAAAVRPGVGRRGRPLKKRPVDLFPDLVERVRREGLMAVDVVDAKACLDATTVGLEATSEDIGDASGSLSTPQETASDGGEALAASSATADVGSAGLRAPRQGAGNDNEGSWRLSTVARNGSARFEKIKHLLPERSMNEEIIEQAVPESCGVEELIEHPFPEPYASDEIIEQPLPERRVSDRKFEHPLPDRLGSEPSDLLARFRLPTPVSACSRDRIERQRYPLGRRSGGVTADQSPSHQEGSPSWWARLLRVA